MPTRVKQSNLKQLFRPLLAGTPPMPLDGIGKNKQDSNIREDQTLLGSSSTAAAREPVFEVASLPTSATPSRAFHESSDDLSCLTIAQSGNRGPKQEVEQQIPGFKGGHSYNCGPRRHIHSSTWSVSSQIKLQLAQYAERVGYQCVNVKRQMTSSVQTPTLQNTNQRPCKQCMLTETTETIERHSIDPTAWQVMAASSIATTFLK